MNYNLFDKLYNTRDKEGNILSCCVIDIRGIVLFEGTPNKVEEFTKRNIVTCNGIPCFICEEPIRISIGIFGTTNISKEVFDKKSLTIEI